MGIETKWKKNKSSDPIIGTDYDFVPGLKGELKTKVIYKVPGKNYIDIPEQRYFNIEIDNSDPKWYDGKLWEMFGEDHISHMEGGWSLKDVGRITMFKNYNGGTNYTELKYGARSIPHK